MILCQAITCIKDPFVKKVKKIKEKTIKKKNKFTKDERKILQKQKKQSK